MTDRKKRQSTTLVEGGRRREWRGRLVNPPVERASTILFDSVAELEKGRPALGAYRYGLQGTATHWALSEALTELEPGAAGTALFSSGLAAITSSLLSLLSAGDELPGYGQRLRSEPQVLRNRAQALRSFDPIFRPTDR